MFHGHGFELVVRVAQACAHVQGALHVYECEYEWAAQPLIQVTKIFQTLPLHLSSVHKINNSCKQEEQLYT